jgi:3-hydroxyisobutyrate dehydrogenase
MHLFPVVRIALMFDHLWIDRFILIGVIGAQNGTLTFMVGAEFDDFKSVQPILANMGKSIIHVGSNGSGVSAKICNNLLAAIR